MINRVPSNGCITPKPQKGSGRFALLPLFGAVLLRKGTSPPKFRLSGDALLPENNAQSPCFGAVAFPTAD
jgi:hypothetical protein